MTERDLYWVTCNGLSRYYSESSKHEAGTPLVNPGITFPQTRPIIHVIYELLLQR